MRRVYFPINIDTMVYILLECFQMETLEIRMQLKMFSDIMVFLKVIEQQSFSGAARSLNISKSIVSKNVARLEKQLGVQLLVRNTRRLAMTEAGRLLFEHCSEVEHHLKQAEHAISHVQEKPQGLLRVGASAGFATWHLGPAIVEFLSQYPEIDVQIEIGGRDEDLIKHNLDLAIRIGDLPDSNLIARKLTARPMRVCASPEYLKRHGVPKHPRDLANHNCLLYIGSPTGEEWHFTKKGESLRIPIKGNFSSTNSQVLEKAAVSGLGIVMLPGYLMIQDQQAGRLVGLLEDYLPPAINIHVVYPHTRYVPPKVRVFIDFLTKRFQNKAYWSVNSSELAEEVSA